MKQLLICPILLVGYLSGTAQQSSLDIKAGTRFEYTVYPPGIIYPVSFTLDSVSKTYLSMSWKSASGFGGKYILTQPSIENADNAFWGPPDNGQEIVLDPNSVMMMLSQKQWKELVTTRQTNLDGMTYYQKEMTTEKSFRIAGKPMDVIYLEGADSSSQLWVLRHPQFPIFLKMVNNPKGVDLVLDDVQ